MTQKSNISISANLSVEDDDIQVNPVTIRCQGRDYVLNPDVATEGNLVLAGYSSCKYSIKSDCLTIETDFSGVFELHGDMSGFKLIYIYAQGGCHFYGYNTQPELSLLFYAKNVVINTPIKSCGVVVFCYKDNKSNTVTLNADCDVQRLMISGACLNLNDATVDVARLLLSIDKLIGVGGSKIISNVKKYELNIDIPESVPIYREIENLLKLDSSLYINNVEGGCYFNCPARALVGPVFIEEEFVKVKIGANVFFKIVNESKGIFLGKSINEITPIDNYFFNSAAPSVIIRDDYDMFARGAMMLADNLDAVHKDCSNAIVLSWHDKSFIIEPLAEHQEKVINLDACHSCVVELAQNALKLTTKYPGKLNLSGNLANITCVSVDANGEFWFACAKLAKGLHLQIFAKKVIINTKIANAAIGFISTRQKDVAAKDTNVVFYHDVNFDLLVLESALITNHATLSAGAALLRAQALVSFTESKLHIGIDRPLEIKDIYQFFNTGLLELLIARSQIEIGVFDGACDIECKDSNFIVDRNFPSTGNLDFTGCDIEVHATVVREKDSICVLKDSELNIREVRVDNQVKENNLDSCGVLHIIDSSVFVEGLINLDKQSSTILNAGLLCGKNVHKQGLVTFLDKLPVVADETKKLADTQDEAKDGPQKTEEERYSVSKIISSCEKRLYPEVLGDNGEIVTPASITYFATARSISHKQLYKFFKNNTISTDLVDVVQYKTPYMGPIQYAILIALMYEGICLGLQDSVAELLTTVYNQYAKPQEQELAEFKQFIAEYKSTYYVSSIVHFWQHLQVEDNTAADAETKANTNSIVNILALHLETAILEFAGKGSKTTSLDSIDVQNYLKHWKINSVINDKTEGLSFAADKNAITITLLNTNAEYVPLLDLKKLFKLKFGPPIPILREDEKSLLDKKDKNAIFERKDESTVLEMIAFLCYYIPTFKMRFDENYRQRINRKIAQMFAAGLHDDKPGAMALYRNGVISGTRGELYCTGPLLVCGNIRVVSLFNMSKILEIAKIGSIACEQTLQLNVESMLRGCGKLLAQDMHIEADYMISTFMASVAGSNSLNIQTMAHIMRGAYLFSANCHIETYVHFNLGVMQTNNCQVNSAVGFDGG